MARNYPWMLFKNLANTLAWSRVLILVSKLQEFLPYLLMMDKKLDIKWHEHFAPKVGRILRIEDVAKKILEKVI